MEGRRRETGKQDSQGGAELGEIRKKFATRLVVRLKPFYLIINTMSSPTKILRRSCSRNSLNSRESQPRAISVAMIAPALAPATLLMCFIIPAFSNTCKINNECVSGLLVYRKMPIVSPGLVFVQKALLQTRIPPDQTCFAFHIVMFRELYCVVQILCQP